MTAKIKLNAASGGGSVSIQAPSSSSNNRVITLPDIADGTLLTSQSSLDSTKLSPAISGGKVLQVVQTVIDSTITVSSNTETEVINVSITPSATNSKVLVTLASAPSYVQTGTEYKLLLYRDSTEVYGYAWYFGAGASGSMSDAIAGPNGMYLDSPNSTSAITYRVKLTRRWGSGNCYFNHTNGDAKTSLTAMEIAA